MANTVRAFLDRRMANIALLKCLGALARLVFLTYSRVEVLAVALVAIAIGRARRPRAVVVDTLLASVLPPLPATAGRMGRWPGGLRAVAALGFAVEALARAMDVRA